MEDGSSAVDSTVDCSSLPDAAVVDEDEPPPFCVPAVDDNAVDWPADETLADDAGVALLCNADTAELDNGKPTGGMLDGAAAEIGATDEVDDGDWATSALQLETTAPADKPTTATTKAR